MLPTLTKYSAQPFVMKNFALDGSSTPPLHPTNRFYLDTTSILFNCEDEVRLPSLPPTSSFMIFNLQDGNIEGMYVLYDNIRHVDLLGSGTVVARLSSPPQCHESLQVASNNAVIKMTITISPKDVDHFIKTLRIRGMVRCRALTDYYLTLRRLAGSH